MRRKSRASGLARDLGQGAGQLHAGRARRRSTTKVSSARAGAGPAPARPPRRRSSTRRRISSASSRRLEARGAAAPTRRGRSRSGRAPAARIEVVVGQRAVGEDEASAGQVDRARPRPAAPSTFAGARRIERMRRGDVARVRRRGRHLVEQRLEEVVVAPVDEGHVDRRRRAARGRVEPAEAAAHDDHVRMPVAVAHRLIFRGRRGVSTEPPGGAGRLDRTRAWP